MNEFIMYGASIISVVLLTWLLIKQIDVKIALFGIGIVLMYIALALGNPIAIEGFESTGILILDPIKAVIEQFKTTLPGTGLIILILGGYSVYMTSIKATDVTVDTLTRPLKRIKSVYILVPIVFLIGNLLSLVIPSASSLAIILLATLYPVLKKAGMSTFTAAAVIATTATIMPTPMGGDNVAIAAELAKYPEYAGMTATEYVIKYHAIVSIPTLLFMAVIHYFWQKFMDKKQGFTVQENTEEIEIAKIEGGFFYRTIYTLLPIFPIVIVVGDYFIRLANGAEGSISIEIAVVVSFIVAIIAECIRTRKPKDAIGQTEEFFKGMGQAFPVVALLVAAGVFVLGLNSIGLIAALQEAMFSVQGTGSGALLPFILVCFTVVIVLLSGSGTALFYAMVPLMVPLATAAGIDPIAVTVPMGLAGNLMRAVSPVSAVVVIVASTTKISPLDVVKRTSVPMISGLVFMFVLSMIMFL